MGKFIGLVAAALSRDGDNFAQTMELVEFGEEAWVYYCRPHHNRPPAGWRDLAEGTLRVSWDPPPVRHDPIEWMPRIACDESTGVCRYAAEQFELEVGNNLFHLALPDHHLPLDHSWDIAPLYGHIDGPRFVIGWAGFEYIWPSFRFAAVAADSFVEEAAVLDRAIDEVARERRRGVFSPWRQGDVVETADLHRRLDQRMDLDTVQALVFELGIDYDNLRGDTKSGKLRELLLFMERNEQLPRLVAHVNERYPAVLGDIGSGSG